MIATGSSLNAETLARVVKGRSLWVDAWRRLKRNRAAMASICVLALITLMAGFAPFLSPFPYDEVNYDLITCAPAWWPGAANCTAPAHIFGTDAVGRDLFVRVLYGARMSLAVGLVATLVSLLIGVVYGATAGYLGGRIDMLMMRVVDVLYALPFIFFVILLVVFFGRNFVLMFLAVGAIEWLDMARIVRGQTLSIQRQDYVLAAEALGVPTRAILTRHIIPNTLGPVIVYVTLLVPKVILLESFLSFLGLGVQEPMTSWGVLISDGARAIQGVAQAIADEVEAEQSHRHEQGGEQQ